VNLLFLSLSVQQRIKYLGEKEKKEKKLKKGQARSSNIYRGIKIPSIEYTIQKEAVKYVK
jgi:hypothetical protein